MAVMNKSLPEGAVGCPGCSVETPEIAIAMAFQPIVDTGARAVFAYEALVRGPAGESAHSVLSSIPAGGIYKFDQQCRIRAIERAAALGMEGDTALTINFMPNAVYEPAACMRATASLARRINFPLSRLIFEITETEAVQDHAHLANIVREYRRMGTRTAMDDFGAGHSNLALLAKIQPDLVKLDMGLIRGVDTDRVQQITLRHCAALCRDLGILVIAEGVETADESATLVDLGLTLQQGFFFARPGFESLPAVAWRG
jgi:EAL domain-containing protein (putative c-di-GMP-specific phosphodiesterase class I)